jgi:hypothetical protein
MCQVASLMVALCDGKVVGGMQVFTDPKDDPWEPRHPRRERTSFRWGAPSWRHIMQWGQFALTLRARNRAVDSRLRELETDLDYGSCPHILALAAQIGQWMHKPIEITPSPFPGELAAMVVGTPTKYIIRYSLRAHPILQLVAICHEFGHIVLNDVEVFADQTGPRIKRRLCGSFNRMDLARLDALDVPDDDDPDPLREAQAERLGTLLRKHWERACPAQSIGYVPSISPLPEDQQAWARYCTYYAPFD